MQDQARKDGDETSITPARYAARWRVPERSAYRLFQDVVNVFGAHPGAVADELWKGVRTQQEDPWLMRLGSVVVVPR